MARYYTPDGLQVPRLYAHILEQEHALIAGTTGAGKSTAMAGIIYTAIALHSPARTQFVLIDPKRVDLKRFKDLPHTIRHATETADIVATLQDVAALVDKRYQAMSMTGATLYNGTDVYVVIDELAFMTLTMKNAVLPTLQKILTTGRASKVHILAATQCPLTSVLPTPLKCCMPARLGLRTVSAQDSRNILGIKGCESLPQHGRGIYLSSTGYSAVTVPMIPDSDIASLIAYWTSPVSIA